MPEGFSIVESIEVAINGLKAALPIVTEFPLNIYLAFSILGCGLGVFAFFKRKH